MTMRPHGYGGGSGGGSSRSSYASSYAGSSAAGEPRPPRGAGGRGELATFGSPFEGGLFGGRDPFAEFGAMDALRGGGLGGGLGGFGSIMSQFDDMTRSAGGSGGRGHAAGGASSLGMGGGQYSCQSFAMSSRMGPDGKMHTERFANSEIGNRSQSIREAQQAYSNSSSGVDKMALERQLGDRGHKVVRERQRGTMEERSTELFKGIDESQREHFDRNFKANAHHLPQHPRFNAQALMAGQGPAAGAVPAGRRGQSNRALPAPAPQAPERHHRSSRTRG